MRLSHLCDLLLELELHLTHLVLHLHHFFPLLLAGLLEELRLRLDLGELGRLGSAAGIHLFDYFRSTVIVGISHGLIRLVRIAGWLRLLVVVRIALVVEVRLLVVLGV